MSSYRYEKVLRVPVEAVLGRKEFTEEERDALENRLNEINRLIKANGIDFGYSLSPTERPFVDFILDADHDADGGDYGVARALSEAEYKEYVPMFFLLNRRTDWNDCIHMVEYCWYTCSEAPDYYDIEPKADSMKSDRLREVRETCGKLILVDIAYSVVREKALLIFKDATLMPQHRDKKEVYHEASGAYRVFIVADGTGNIFVVAEQDKAEVFRKSVDTEETLGKYIKEAIHIGKFGISNT